MALPEDSRATVGDGLRGALRRSGYQLCETAQYQLGVGQCFSGHQV
ncbi:hypothetical protein CRJUMX01_1170012 [Escherichia coli]|nr:hypothetical protein CRJUMX01_1170012 [Escherichia coli]